MRLRSKVLAVVGAWCLVIALTPLMRDRFPAASGFLYLFFSPICHQLPERSFYIVGHQLPVCARCTGIYLGAFVGSLIASETPPSRWVLMVAIFPLLLDGGTQLLFRESTNTLRLATGLAAGCVASFYVYAGLCRWNYAKNEKLQR
ncbi:MAG: DUF2085 domain-containing protein [Theionarchaea archaeon]|nr:DUF2085 domain-containing protein [Theionarchaea archaeon]MBU7038549.1 DUF2085 domain-containing protein [Theionarchaea archaeon]